MRCCPDSSSWLRLRIPTSEEEVDPNAAAAALWLSQSEEEGGEGAEIVLLRSEPPRRRRRLEAGFLGLSRFFARVMVATMGCFLSCFRVKDVANPSAAPADVSSSSSKPGVAVGAVTRNRSPLSSFLIPEGNNGVVTKLKDDQEQGTPGPEFEFNVKVLKEEASFLKACGTIAETPAEIRKVSKKLKDVYSQEEKHECPEYKSWLTDASIEKLNVQSASDRPLTPSKGYEQGVNILVSLEDTPSSCMTDGQNAGRIFAIATQDNEAKNSRSIEFTATPSDSLTGSSVTTGDIAPSQTCKNKSVRFDFDSDKSSASSKSCSSEMPVQNSKQFGSSIASISKFSPYPTPLKLSDEMQTPGTVFPAYVDAMPQGNNPRIRCQYVYSVLNPVENLAELKELKNDGSNSDHQNNYMKEEYSGLADEESPMSEEAGTGSVGKDLKLEANLASWLKEPFFKGNDHVEYNGSNIVENFRYRRTPADRPILGMVAAHWNDAKPSQLSPKWWDGNGIPNSTNKYKEDQKVSWHATPFEERLEKALSEETLSSQREVSNRTPPPDFTEAEESDTAVSRLQTSSHYQSVVSC